MDRISNQSIKSNNHHQTLLPPLRKRFNAGVLAMRTIPVMVLLFWSCSSSLLVNSFELSQQQPLWKQNTPSFLIPTTLPTRRGQTSIPNPLEAAATTRAAIPRRIVRRKSSALRTSTSTALHSLVGAEDSWGNLATLSAVGVVAQNVGNSTKVGRLLGAPVTAMAITFLLASVGVLSPGGTSSSRNLQGLSIRLATPWILLGADFGGGGGRRKRKQINQEDQNSAAVSPIPLVFGFGIASIATLAGGLVGWRTVGNSLVNSALGPHNGLAIAAALLAKNIGGGINYVAVCAALSASPEAIATGLCIDNIGALVYFPISNLLASRYPDPCATNSNTNEKSSSSDATAATAAPTPPQEPPRMTAESISAAFFAAATLLWLGDSIAVHLLKSPSAQIPVVTLLAVLVAGILAPNLPTLWFDKWLPKGLKKTCDTLGTVFLFLFFTTAGAPGIQVAKSMKSALWPLSVFSVILYGIHGAILAACYQLGSRESSFRKGWRGETNGNGSETARSKTSSAVDTNGNDNDNDANASSSWKWKDVLSPQRLLVASSSAIGGPPTSVALARTVGWDSLVVPALLVGNIGYAISTFVGIAFYYFFQQ